MSRNLKALGLALIAVLALSAVAAGAAQAETPIVSELASPGVTNLDAKDVTGTEDGKLARLTIGGGVRFVECTESNQLTLNPIVGSATTLTATPHYEKCFSNGLSTVPATVTHNGCTLTLTATKENAEKKVLGDVTIDCPAGKTIEVHVYESAAAHTANKSFCTYTIGPQTLTGATITTAGAGATREINLNLSTLSPAKVTNDGTAGLASCGLAVGATGNGSFTGNFTAIGTNAGTGAQVGIFLG